MKILISDSALNDLEAIKEYYLNEGVPQIGLEFVIEIIKHIETLPTNPEIGRKVSGFTTLYHGFLKGQPETYRGIF